MSFSSFAYDSGSTGSDGAFNPSADIELQLSPSGIFNFTTVNIPSGVTVTFAKNAGNTPVTILASGDVNIAGTIDINGGNSADTSDTDLTGDGLPGIGGSGGFDGGHGGYSGSGTNNDGGHGQGPGGADSGRDITSNSTGCGGAGAGYNGNGINFTRTECAHRPQGGSAYGIDALMPLVGGSGGGGGSGIPTRFGSGGGGGGGAILIASSGTINLSGTVSAIGGSSGNTGINFSCSGAGGGGSGGAIRIIATTLTGTGTVSASAGIGDSGSAVILCLGTNGAPGRIRLETENMQFTAQTSPPFSFSGPSPIFVPNLPGIIFTSIAGIVAPGTPTGSNDVILPENTANPVEVILASSGIPAGGIITLTATPLTGSAISANSSAIAADGSATVSINLPNGPSTLIASTTFLVTASLGSDYSQYAQGEQVEKVRVGMNSQGQSETTFITASGKEYTWSSNTVMLN